MLFRFLILIPVCVAFPLKCPEPAQWSFRARSHCPDASKYFCLRNDLINGYSENCTVYDFLQPGRKNVLRGGLDADVCSSERYQPWPINFYTNVSTNCIFLKSTCNEEGQVIYDKGNRNIDATCTCDYTRGYDFLVKPHNPCFCVPTKEDCSCNLKTCPNSNDRLSTDYECRQEDQNLTVSECTAIIYKRLNTTRKKNPRKYIHVSTKKISSAPVQKKLILTAICIGMMFFFCIGVLFDELMDRYFWKVYCIYQPLGYIQLIEGQSVAFKYIISNNKFAVSFLKDDQFIAETKRIKKSISGCCKVLEITHVVPRDEGLYCLKIEDKKNAFTRLTIQRMFTLKIDPQLCIEGDTLQMTCSVYVDNIEVQWYKGEQELNECDNILIHSCKTVRMLTIKKTTVNDSGKYFVKAGNAKMEIQVTVKDMFRRPLVDVTIMEGLDTQFECETELENVPVQWFYNSENRIDSSERRQIQSFKGRVHTLTISQTSLQDSGKYSIDIKGCAYTVALNVREMPETIQHMSVKDREAFLKAAKIGITKRYNIRVMIVGKEKAGKTCLLRRLMNEEIGDVKSTDGINIERRKCYIDIKTGEWHFTSCTYYEHH